MNVHVSVGSGRLAGELEQRRLCKIASSPHAYVRGSTARFYDLLAELPAGRVPEGPPVWICGDCHLGNLGALAGPDGDIAVQIRDLDQAVVSNPAYDLVRLALSLVVCALDATLPGIVVTRMMDAMAAGYAEGLADPDGTGGAAGASRTVATARRRALGRGWRDLSRERLKGGQSKGGQSKGGKAPRLPRGKRFYDLDPDEHAAFAALLHDPEVAALVLSLDGAGDGAGSGSGDGAGAEITLRDAAYWIKGCSSLGRLRYAGLVEIAGADRPRFALIDVKEAVPHLAPAAAGADMPADHARRVVAGARVLSPNLGARMAAGRFRDTPVTVRELAPQDLKIDADRFSRDEAVRAAGHLTAIVGRAHGRQMDAATRAAWIEAVGAARADAPGWLWEVVTDLSGAHQRGYLEHCRRLERETGGPG